MKWKAPAANVFFIPWPYTGQNLSDLMAFHRYEDKQPETLQLTNPQTGEKQNFQIIDYLGPYEMKNPPNFLARLCTDKAAMTGKMLASLLRSRIPEFKFTEKIVFYQLKSNE